MKNQNTKTQKGITLVALVITIIVLLILAAVAIGAIQNKGIIKYAQNASADYETAEKQEQSVLASLLDKIKEKVPGNESTGNDYEEEKIPQIPSGVWTNTGDGKIVSNNGDILEIGVTKYTTEQVKNKLGIALGKDKYNGNWVVMGVEDEKIKLVSEDIVKENVVIAGQTSLYSNMISVSSSTSGLNNAVEDATGITGARSIKKGEISDINFILKGDFWLAESVINAQFNSFSYAEGLEYVVSGEVKSEKLVIPPNTIKTAQHGVCAVILIYDYPSYLPEGPWTNNGDGTLTASTGEKVEIGVTKYSTNQVLKALGLTYTEGNYFGPWVVIGVDGTKLKLVSQDNVGNDITLGVSDPTVNMDEIEEIYDNPYDTETNLDLEKAIWSWNHAVDTLDNAAKAQTGITSARSIRLEDLEAEDVLNITEEVKKTSHSTYGKTYKYYLNNGKIYSASIEVDDPNVDDSEESWSNESEAGNYDVFVNWDKTVIDSTDENKGNIVKLKDNWYRYYFTSEQREKFVNSLANRSYWLASQEVYCYGSYATYGVFSVENGKVEGSTFISSAGHLKFSRVRGVRAVVSL